MFFLFDQFFLQIEHRLGVHDRQALFLVVDLIESLSLGCMGYSRA